MAELKDRVGTLEAVLGSFIVQTEKAIRELKHEMSEFKDEMSEFKDEMKEFKNEMSEFKDEMSEFKNEMSEFKDEMREDRKRMSMDWGHLANRLGTIAEDIAAPGIRGMLKKHFHREADTFMVRVITRSKKDPSVRKEFDVVAVTEDLFFLGEIKTTLRQQYIEDFIQLIAGEVYDYFPEYREKKLVPVFASLSMDESLVGFFTKHNIIALAMGVDHMEVMNESVLEKYIS